MVVVLHDMENLLHSFQPLRTEQDVRVDKTYVLRWCLSDALNEPLVDVGNVVVICSDASSVDNSAFSKFTVEFVWELPGWIEFCAVDE